MRRRRPRETSGPFALCARSRRRACSIFFALRSFRLMAGGEERNRANRRQSPSGAKCRREGWVPAQNLFESVGSRREMPSRGFLPAQNAVERVPKSPSRATFAPAIALSRRFCAGTPRQQTLSRRFCAGTPRQPTLSRRFCAGHLGQSPTRAAFAPDLAAASTVAGKPSGEAEKAAPRVRGGSGSGPCSARRAGRSSRRHRRGSRC